VELLRSIAASFWTRVVVSLGLLAFVASRIDVGAGASRLSHGRWGWFVAAVGVLFLSFLVAARRWFLFLEAAGVGGTLSNAVRAYLIGAFTSNFLPTQFGGDVTRAWIAGRPGTRIRAAATVVVDRATALGCLIVVAWVVLALDPGPVPGSLVLALSGATAALCVAGFVVAGFFRSGTPPRRLFARFDEPIRDVRAAVRACLRGRVFWRTAVLGLLFQALVALALWLVARSIALHASFSVLAVTLPVVLLLAAAPVSIGGLGVREGSFVLLLGQAKVGATEATLLSLMSGATLAIASLPGGVAILVPRVRRPAGRSAAAQSDDREQERREEHLDPGDRGSRGENREPRLGQRAEAAADPRAEDRSAGDQPG
jgi:uncharacterized membrane protein YbhN (UPF0104 family)